jgi:dTDP-4-dehydrorhamnose reductase
MRVLVFGRTGQLARSLHGLLGQNAKAQFVSREQADFSGDPDFARHIGNFSPDFVINAVAYTAVDKAETENDIAFKVNSESPGKLAAASAAAGIPMFHVSTDYVFSGDLDRPYIEDDETNPKSVYGHSKLNGEAAVLSESSSHFIVRTAWVYSHIGQNFVNTMLRLGKERNHLSIVDDQFGNPTASDDLAAALINICAKLYDQKQSSAGGIYHVSGRGEVTSWYGFACEIFNQAKRHGLTVPQSLEPISTSAYQTPAQRPSNSRLDNSKLFEDFQIELPDWKNSIERAVKRISIASRTEQEKSA